ncbi:phosphatase PAP2 family protein [Streptomyces iconiensis]|uniref:Phosphatase PAP2 family protein n=1 Tax=Streptomyces iconiensis TaxID=1384038 RepID=A0ABT7A7G7_9ACTN|nr:phosphatase PAP2 family protein [Streptomyces iconiensis]MDJ1137266.1 phosphatase PAP2 family protein [Streptomyces iconiensis]
MHGPTPPGGWCVRAAAALGGLAVLVIALTALEWRPLLALDRGVATGLHSPALAHPGWTHTHRVLTDWVWDPWTFRLLLALAVVWLVWRGERLLALWTAGTALVGTGVQQGLKALLGRERPRWKEPVDSADFAAMPSGHAMTAALGCVLLLWLLRGRGGAVGAVLWRCALGFACVSVAGVAFTRVWLGVHWLTDTVAGVLLGTALGLASLAVARASGRRGELLPGPVVRGPGVAGSHGL